MHNAIVTAGEFIKGQSILIQGASSGVGLMGLQMAKHLEAKMIIGTSTKPEKFDRLKQLGADFVVNSKTPKWSDEVLTALSECCTGSSWCSIPVCCSNDEFFGS